MDEVVVKPSFQSDVIHLVTADNEENLSVTCHVIDQLQANLKDKFNPHQIQVIISRLVGLMTIPAQIKDILNYDGFYNYHLKAEEFECL